MTFSIAIFVIFRCRWVEVLARDWQRRFDETSYWKMASTVSACPVFRHWDDGVCSVDVLASQGLQWSRTNR